ncbi:SDR family NAD(P)-dependent oxidoreductase [Kitasatospora griseola]|uniref:SDR family NAD(P)-dependent oxidoreductase n=1 Tax=Kitasatospora griseola TaxID=2064 RepID=UPI00381AFCA7
MSRFAVVSGGGTGIGKAVAAALAAEGTEVLLLGRRAEVLDAAVAELNDGAGGKLVRSLTADLAEPEDVARIADGLAAVGRTVDVLVNNAGGNLAPQQSEDLGQIRRDWLANFTGNVLPVVLLTQALLPVMARPGGRVVTVGSVAALRGSGSYGGAKAALHPWSSELALKVAPEGITVNVVAPGYIGGTEFYGDRMSDDFHADRSRQAPVGRGGTVEEVAAAVLYLAGPGGGFTTGQVLQVNGGAVTGRG